MNTNKTEYYDIVAGPNKDALFDACKYAHSKAAKIPIDFEVVLGYTLPPNEPGSAYIPMDITDISITCIEYEDNSGESFNLNGNCCADPDFTGGSKPYRFKAYYNSKKRKGRIAFEE